MRYYLFIYLLRYLFWFFIFWDEFLIFCAVLLLTLCQCAALRCYISWVCIIIKPSLYILMQSFLPLVHVTTFLSFLKPRFFFFNYTFGGKKNYKFCIKKKGFIVYDLWYLLGRMHMLPLMFEDLRGSEGQVFVADVAVVNPAETGRRRGARLYLSRLWNPAPQKQVYA